MADRAPLAGWRTVGVEDRLNVGSVDMGVTQYGYWYVDIEGGAHGQVRPGAPRRIAAEDAARAMVADMAEALGGRVVWADAREGVCRWTDSPDGDGWTAACGWGCWMLPADATDQTRNGFCGGCGGRIETTDAGEGGE